MGPWGDLLCLLPSPHFDGHRASVRVYQAALDLAMDSRKGMTLGGKGDKARTDEDSLENLPDLESSRNDGDKKTSRKSLILRAVDAIKEGATAEVGDTRFNLNRKGASIMSQIGDAAVEMAVNRHLEAKAKAKMPLMGGNTEVEVIRDAEGKHSFGMQSSIPLFGGNLEAQASRDTEGKRSAGIQFRKEF